MGDPVILYNRVPHPPGYRRSTFHQLSLNYSPYTLRWEHLTHLTHLPLLSAAAQGAWLYTPALAGVRVFIPQVQYF
nr:hypothetical protein [Cressdnaviricota sp.]